MVDTQALMKREFLRGYLEALNVPSLVPLAVLNEVYEKYLEDNPPVLKDLEDLKDMENDAWKYSDLCD